jgi:hypothetical protein
VATALDIVHTATQEVGFIEGPNNENKYGAWYGLNNEPYCAIFLSWVFAQNNLSHLVAAQTPKGFSYCPAGLAWYQRNLQVVGKYAGQPGDIVFYSFAGNGIADHTEIIVGASRDGITTVGGNTSPDHAVTASQANGNGVYLRHRPYLYVLAICRPNYETSLAPTKSVGTNKAVAGGVAATTALAGGGVAATHQTTTTPTKATSSFVAPAWKASDFALKAKSASTIAVEKALYKAGLLPAVAQNSGWTQADNTAVKAFQKKNNLTQGAMNQATYNALMKELP